MSKRLFSIHTHSIWLQNIHLCPGGAVLPGLRLPPAAGEGGAAQPDRDLPHNIHHDSRLYCDKIKL